MTVRSSPPNVRRAHLGRPADLGRLGRLSRYARDRGVIAVVASLAGGSALFVVGCTLLIPFDAAESTKEAGLNPTGGTVTDPQVQAGAPDARIDPPRPDAEADARPSDASKPPPDPIANPEACRQKSDGKYCSGNRIDWTGGQRDDLITCANKSVGNVRLCGGAGCIRFQAQYPDECDGCIDKANGTYCGSELKGWSRFNANSLVTCKDQSQTAWSQCAGTCSQSADVATCK